MAGVVGAQQKCAAPYCSSANKNLNVAWQPSDQTAVQVQALNVKQREMATRTVVRGCVGQLQRRDNGWKAGKECGCSTERQDQGGAIYYVVMAAGKSIRL
jgi:hypothetical protein